MKNKIVVATRPSLLAYTQTVNTVSLLQKAHPSINFEIKKFKTQGDRNQKSSLTEFGGTGVFVKELESAILTGKADIAIHSLKDVPSKQPEGLLLAAFPTREDPRDVLITKNKPIKIIGTGSPRRLLQCALKFPKVKFTEIRGNIETRLHKLEQGECDATLLAAAGLNRLQVKSPNSEHLAIDSFIPAVGQGAIAIECLQNDSEIQKIVRTINDEDTEITVMTERAFMEKVEGGCKFPLGAHAHISGEKIHFYAIIGNLQTMQYVRQHKVFDKSVSITEAVSLAEQMLQECKKNNIYQI